MKEMIETRGLEVRRYICDPHRQATCKHTGEEQSCNRQSSKAQIYHPCLHISKTRIWKSRQIMTKTSCSKIIKIIYKQENQHIQSEDIQQRVYTCEVSKTIMVITTKKCYFVDLIIMVLSTFE